MSDRERERAARALDTAISTSETTGSSSVVLDRTAAKVVLALLREQEREPDAYASTTHNGEYPSVIVPEPMGTFTTPVYFGNPPTSTSEGAECTCAVGLSEKCDVHGATPPEPESEDDDGGFDSVTVRAGRAYTYCSECGATEVLGHLRSCPRAEPESEEA